jgi:hypothetical protein
VTPTTSIKALAAPPAATAPLPVVVHCEPAVVLDRVGKGLRGARARTGMTEADVVAILARQGITMNIHGLRRAESTGDIALGLAGCLADIYGTTTDGLAGRRPHRQGLSLDSF